ncbi:hypothetical protein [Tenacibaculum finnmarkense]|uniref:hypothetical protein n=1 Tax=Tenacibaculum finnmarkense TaxID=2781243 RepID=UPI001E5E2ABD|nr:hypothetical protein [Tenacibaculum finnmarkense]MCD8401426.1 hypothetical protein [Tenacibaculum finnmarkense genomovar ulcerans]MCD8413533.1 hypothetical protein [Tenacibaculum finnmarkense genomovar ulcerans]MCG8208439.1 hypothetical protein [Tenacibaculum finnmarkense genomovar finnmarkense]MCG8724382.1 hypothetical protein [Tenacibaculum finnmarkense]MCG8742689.1 hypothetical protein [Tenacibaculum finnmarkense]
MKVLKILGKTILGIILSFVLFIYIISIQRDESINVRNLEIEKNIIIPVKRVHSQKKYYGSVHFGFGGGDVKSSIEFKYKALEYYHNTGFIPIVIKFYNNNFYLIYYDRETDFNNIVYRYYKSNQKREFEEINATDFPRSVVIQNWFWHSDSNASDLIGLDPKKIKNTTTVYLWYLIEGKPKTYYWDTREEFIKQYKEKYL